MGPEKTRLAYLQERKEAVYENLRDLNFEHQAGKLPDAGLSVAEGFARGRSGGHSGGDGAAGTGRYRGHSTAEKEPEFEGLSQE